MRGLSILIFVFLVDYCAQGQYFHPNIEDKKYLDRIGTDVTQDAQQATQELIRQAKIVEEAAKVFIGAKLKQNLFKALRVLAEKELQAKPLPSWSRQEEEEDEEEDIASSTSSNSTNIFPNVANLVKAIFGGNSINLTSYVQSATKFLPQSVGNQVLGVVKLLSHNPSPRITTPVPTLKPKVKSISTTSSKEAVTTTVVKEPSVVEKIVPVSTPAPVTASANSTTSSSLSASATTTKSLTPTTAKPTTTSEDDEEEEEEENRAARQLKLPELGDLPGFNLLGQFFNGNSASTSKPSASRRNGTATTESAHGFEEEKDIPAAGGLPDLNLDSISNGIRMGVGDLIKVVPDLFKGAREAVGLLSGIQNLLGAFGGLTGLGS